MSGVSGREVGFAPAAYGSVKAALVHYAHVMAVNLAKVGIRVNSVSPGIGPLRAEYHD